MENYLNILNEKISDADMILVGIGEDFGCTEKQIFEKERYCNIFSKISASGEWMLPYAYSQIMRKGIEKQAYLNLAGLIKDKNYFIVSLRTDDVIYGEEYAFDKERIVTPCGGGRKLQCDNNCEDKIFDIPDEIKEKIDIILQEDEKEILNVSIEPLRCPNCGSNLVFNRIDAKKYCEAGYLFMWDKYTKWLQGTLNRKICILELGVGMKYPSVVRWPFEKIAFFNNKAYFFRIHKKLYHLTEELGEKGCAVAQNPIDFLINSFE